MKPCICLSLFAGYFFTATSALAQTPGLAAVAPTASVPGPPLAPTPLAAALPSAAGSLLTPIFALLFVLALLVAIAWLLKRYGPKATGAGSTVRLVGSLSLGGRERIIVIEVADQWIVVGAAPGRVNALATMPRPAGATTSAGVAPPASLTAHGLPSTNFADWLKQTLEKRNGK